MHLDVWKCHEMHMRKVSSGYLYRRGALRIVLRPSDRLALLCIQPHILIAAACVTQATNDVRTYTPHLSQPF